ncbi:MAG: PolC-type DNA polymerase III, partial [Anaerovoracaceae bacterium]
ADFDEHIKTGTYIRVQGNCEFDSFEKMNVIMAQSIEKAEKKMREDKSARKRIELHAHTKMSQIDGVMDVAELIGTAKAWGHPAVAVTDHGVVQAFPDAVGKAKGIKVIYGVEGYLVEDIPLPDGKLDYKTNPARHIILLAKNQTGIKNLYKLVSYSYIDYHYKRPRMPRSEIIKHREGLIIGSACEAGEFFRAVTAGASDEELMKIAEFYDYLEIQPRCNNRFMLRKGMVNSEEDLLNFNRKVVEIGRRMGKPVAATCDAHYLNEEDYIYRNIIMAAHGFKELDEEPSLYLKTTDEMLAEFAYLGEKEAERVVIDDPQAIADMIDDDVRPISDEKCPPQIEGSEERLRSRCYDKAHEIYGDPLPEIVEQRLDRELTSIIGNGYAVMYVAAELLVQKSLADGYLVGSRGSVGSSFAATMDGITEVNPLQPHYICPNPDCKHSEFPEDYESDCGVDLPDKVCPVCGTPYIKEGHNIPFEVFLGFKGDKEPDIDLNFAGEYQPVAHKFVEEIFGAENVFRAGTIGTIKDKTALGYVRRYLEERGRVANKCEMERLALGCSGVRKTTGQHPGGMVVVPRGREIYEFCPVMHPAEGSIKDTITTHFDYHKIEKNLLKLDILGHDVPSMIRMLQDMTGISPEDIPLRDEKVNRIFLGVDTLDIKIDDYKQRHGTFGIPEFGTSFTRQMLDDTQPKKFADLVRIAGFSHGTDVWLNNAQEFIRSGQATMDDAIATRDDIMNYLISKGVPKQDSFTIMERVRKGKSITEEQEALMMENSVPDWYIESCKRIKYMFPKAHAVAYVMMSYRIAYFKVYYPAAFYAVHYTIKVDFFNAKVNLAGMESVLDRMDQIRKMGDEATNKEKDEYLVYEVVYEMYARGIEFLPAELGKSQAVRFAVEDGKIRIPFRALEGMGETAALSLEREYAKQPFSSIEDMSSRTSVNSSNIETLREHGVLNGMSESDQLTLFSMF